MVEEKELRALVTRGYSFNKIHKILNISKASLRKVFKKYNIPTPLAYARSKLNKDYLEKRIIKGATLRELAVEVRRSSSVIQYQLDKFGLKTKGQVNLEEINKLKDCDLSKSVKGILVGAMLGDSWIQEISDNRYIFNIQHCEKQKEYAYYKSKILLKGLFRGKAHEYPYNPLKDKFFRTTAYHYCSISHSYFKYLYLSMYRDGEKIVPEEVLKDLTLFGVAIWFGDDGSASIREKTYYFSTQSFSLKYLKILRRWIFNNLKVNSTIMKNKVLRISRNSVYSFERLMSPFIITLPGVSYKMKYFEFPKNPQRLIR